jgi:hypothetical protein
VLDGYEALKQRYCWLNASDGATQSRGIDKKGLDIYICSFIFNRDVKFQSIGMVGVVSHQEQRIFRPYSEAKQSTCT